LKHLGIINDRTLAESLKRKALHTKLLSKKGTERYILSRGIPREIVQEVLGNDVNDDIENAKILTGKKLKTLRKYPLKTVKRRLYALLMRRAYSFDTIQRILNDKNIFKEDEK
jgi:SOS response regulatory protein OraA/RecX